MKKLKKTPQIWQNISLIANILPFLVVIFYIYEIETNSGHGDAMEAAILLAMIGGPLYIIGLLLTLFFCRTKRNLILLITPFVLIVSSLLYERLTHLSYFDPDKYQYLVGKNISETRELYQKALRGTGQTEENGKKGYILPGMVMWVDGSETIVAVEPTN